MSDDTGPTRPTVLQYLAYCYGRVLPNSMRDWVRPPDYRCRQDTTARHRPGALSGPGHDHGPTRGPSPSMCKSTARPVPCSSPRPQRPAADGRQKILSGYSERPSTRSRVAIAARSHPRTPRNAYRGGSSSDCASVFPSRSAGPQSLPRWVQELFPGLRPGRMPERRLIIATTHPIMPRTHIDTPAARQIACRLQFCQHDRVVPQCRTDHAIASLDQHLDKAMQPSHV